MKFLTINTTSYNKDKIIGIDPIQQDTEHQISENDTWYFIVYIQDAIEEIVQDDDVSNLMATRNRILNELEEDTQLETLLKRLIALQEPQEILQLADETLNINPEKKQLND